MQFKIILILIMTLTFFSCKENSNPISSLPSKARFVVDSLNITANPDSVHAKLMYHFEGSPGYLSSFTLEVYYSGNTEAYGIKLNGPIDSVGINFTKYKAFKLYITPAVGYSTISKCTITGCYVTLTEKGWEKSESFTWSDSTKIIIS